MLNAMDALTLLRRQIDYGADEALQATPRDRLAPVPAAPAPRAPAPIIAPPAGGAVAQAHHLAAAAATLTDLHAALAAFEACPLQATAKHLVFGDGPEHAPLMLIGDIAGEPEDRSGRAFSGPAGDLLDRMLAGIGLARADLRLTYVIPWRPPGNRKPTDHERALCLPFLHRQIALSGPKRLVLLGTLAASTLLDAPPATHRRLRGQWQSATVPGLDSPLPALPTLGPTQLLTTPALRAQAWEDLLTLRLALNEDGH